MLLSLIAIIVLALSALLAYTLFKPNNAAEALPFWQAHDDANSASIDHSAWQAVLDRYLDSGHSSGVNRFAYGNVDDAAVAQLEEYIEALAAIDPRQYSRIEQKAYWINLYNALTVQLVVDNYPLASITKLGDSATSFGPWDDYAINIAGQDLSLNAIEHGILRPLWQDPRIHYAVNCASYGCPNLQAKAFTALNTEQLLDKGAREYINHERGVSFVDGELLVSSIFHWYKIDFGNTDNSLIEHLASYAEPALKQQLQNYDGAIDHAYDWGLNGE